MSELTSAFMSGNLENRAKLLTRLDNIGELLASLASDSHLQVAD